MATISLCMIVRDEAEVLARCLDSVQDLVDEIIIVDTGSTDGTKAIAARYTAKVFDFPWIDDFAAARNFSFAQATMEYQFWLDADDLLEDADRVLFQQQKEGLNPAIDLVMLPYNVGFDDSGRPTLTFYRERLFARAKQYQWTGVVHEVIVPLGQVAYGQAAVSHHKMHLTDPQRNLRIYENLMAQGLLLEPRHQFYYGRELYYSGRYQEAVNVFTQYLEENQGWLENKINACCDLAQCYTLLGLPQAAFGALFRSFTYDIPRAEVCCAIGSTFLSWQMYRPAAYWYERAMELKPDYTSGGFVSPDCYNFIPSLQLCVCYDRLGDKARSFAYHQRAKALKPNDPVVLQNEQWFQSQNPSVGG